MSTRTYGEASNLKSSRVTLAAGLLLSLLLLLPADCRPNNQLTSHDSVAENVTMLEIVPRASWGAQPPKAVNPLRHSPAPFVVVHHTYIPGACLSGAACQAAMRAMQRSHQHDRGWLDIGYSFAIGGDGKVYAGRGWGTDGAHAPRYNDKSVGISFIGDYRTELPSPAMLEACHQLIALGVSLGHIRVDHVLLGHRQTRVTECPGQALYDHIATWRHFSATVPDDPQDFEPFMAARNIISATLEPVTNH